MSASSDAQAAPRLRTAIATVCISGTLEDKLEVFNDAFRQSDPRQAAVDAHRSLLALHESTLGHLPAPAGPDGAVPPPLPTLGGFAFAEVAVDEQSGPEVAGTLSALGFTHTGQHRSKPVQLWEQGGARVLLNSSAGPDEHPTGAAVAALGLETANPPDAAARAQALLAPILPRRRGPAEADLSAVAAPDGTSVFFCRGQGGVARRSLTARRRWLWLSAPLAARINLPQADEVGDSLHTRQIEGELIRADGVDPRGRARSGARTAAAV